MLLTATAAAIAVSAVALPAGFVTFDAPVEVNDTFVFSCLDSMPQPSEPLGLSGNWNSIYAGSSLSVRIAVPGRPVLILTIRDSPNEILGYLLSCSDTGSVVDSVMVYSWNSEGFESLTAKINTDDSIILSTGRLEEFGGNSTSICRFTEEGYFTPVLQNNAEGTPQAGDR